MPTVTIQNLLCVRSASGIDGGVFEAFAQVPSTFLPDQMSAIIASIRSLPGVIEAIDAARSDPDNIYMTTSTNKGRANAIWPPQGVDIDMLPDQSQEINLSVDFEFSQNISLFDHDPISSDDHLGSIMVKADEAGTGSRVGKAASQVEGSIYFITYEVS
jgi:hypothetical protein